MVSPVLRNQLIRDFRMARRAGELGNHVTVPIQLEPAHTFEDCLYRLVRGARAVRVFDA